MRGVRNKAPTRSYWRSQLVQWLAFRDDLEGVTVADMPSWVKSMAKGEPEAMLRAEVERRAGRDAA